MSSAIFIALVFLINMLVNCNVRKESNLLTCPLLMQAGAWLLVHLCSSPLVCGSWMTWQLVVGEYACYGWLMRWHGCFLALGGTGLGALDLTMMWSMVGITTSAVKKKLGRGVVLTYVAKMGSDGRRFTLMGEAW